MTATGLRLLALLALTAGGFAIAMLVPAGRAILAPYRRALAATVPGVATAGSLWLSEGVGFLPCRLCWWQRFVMYPLALALPVLVSRVRPHLAARLAVPAALVGAAISTWHLLVQARPSLGGACSLDVPCSVAYVRELGFLTIPAMALLGFVAIAALLAPDLRRRDDGEAATADGAADPGAVDASTTPAPAPA